MIALYKLIHGNYDRNTSNIINLYKDHNKLNERTRAVNMWNFLPEHAVNAPSVDAMKKLYMTTKQPHQQDANPLHRLEHKI